MAATQTDPYAGSVLRKLFRIDEREAGRGVDSPHSPRSGFGCTPGEVRRAIPWVSLALSFKGLKALGVPPGISRQVSLRSFSRAWLPARESWATRLEGKCSRALGKHARVCRSPRCESLRSAPDAQRLGSGDGTGSTRVYTPDLRHHRDLAARIVHALPTETERLLDSEDGISHPASGWVGRSRARIPHELPLKPGEFRAWLSPTRWEGCSRRYPQPERIWVVMGVTWCFASCINGSPHFVNMRRRTLSGPEDEELVAAKMMGRWRSGAPLALCPLHDDPGTRAQTGNRKQRLSISGRRRGLGTGDTLRLAYSQG